MELERETPWLASSKSNAPTALANVRGARRRPSASTLQDMTGEAVAQRVRFEESFRRDRSVSARRARPPE